MSSKLIKTNDTYRNWIQKVSGRFRQSQIKAAVKVNDEMLRFYWSLGRDISLMNAEIHYGSGFYQAVSSDLKEIFPNVHSFSVTNLKYMRYFYELYSDVENRPQVGDGLEDYWNRPQVGDDSARNENRQLLIAEAGKGIIFSIPWGHHKLLIDKCSGNQSKALFYVRKTVENNWSRAMLLMKRSRQNSPIRKEGRTHEQTG